MDKRMWTDGFVRKKDAQKKDGQTSRCLEKQMTNKMKTERRAAMINGQCQYDTTKAGQKYIHMYIFKTKKRDETKQSGCVKIRCSTNKTALTGQDTDGWIVTLTLLINY